MLIGGLFLPLTFAIWGGVYIIGRLGYTCAYMKAPKKRAMFVPIIMFAQFLMPLVAAVCCVLFYFYRPVDGIDTIKSGVHTGLWNN